MTPPQKRAMPSRHRVDTLRVNEARQKNTLCRRKYRELERIRRDAAQSVAASIDNTDCLRKALMHRVAAAHAKKVVFKLSEDTSARGEEYQRVFFQKLIEQPLLETLVPEYVKQRRQLELSRVDCDGLAQAWSGLKYGIGRDRFLARNVIEAAVISIGYDRCMRAAATCVGMNKKTVRRAIQRRCLLNNRSDGEVWAKIFRRKRKDALEQWVVDRVISWWTDETRVSPCKKDVRSKRISFKTRVFHATHWLEESQLDFYTRFRAANRDISVGYVAWRRLKPFFVKRLTDFNSCCCRYHQEMQEITVGFLNMRANRVHVEVGENSCGCGCPSLCSNFGSSAQGEGVVSCQVAHFRYKHSSKLWEQTLCSRLEGSEWHSKRCLRGDCKECGFQLIPLCERELDSNNQNTMQWRRFEMVSSGSKTRKGDPKQVIRLEYKVTLPKDFLDYAKPKIKQFVWHQFVARLHDTQYRQSVQDLKPGEVLSLIDFAENYSYKGQSEIQSQHWFSFQCTILVHITYQINQNHDPEDPQSKRLQTEYHYYISDDRIHDSLYVQHCLMLHWTSLVAADNIPTRHIVWSDGCASQFKGAKAWFFVSKYPSLTSCERLPTGCMMDWNY